MTGKEGVVTVIPTAAKKDFIFSCPIRKLETQAKVSELEFLKSLWGLGNEEE